MKKNFLVSGIKGSCLTGFTGKRSYNVDIVSCNENSTYVDWVEWIDDDEEGVNCSVSLVELIEAYQEKLEKENSQKRKDLICMKTLNYNPMDKFTWGYDMLDKVNTLFVFGHPHSNTCENCWNMCKLPDKGECDDNGNSLANGIYGNMLIQMKLGNVEKIYGVNCYNKNMGIIDEDVLQSIAVFRIVR